MNERELRQLLAKLRGEYEEMRDSSGLEELRNKLNEIRDIKEKLDMELELRGIETPPVKDPEIRETGKDVPEVRDLTSEQLDKEYEGTFLRAVRNKPLTKRDQEIFDAVLDKRDAPTVDPYYQSSVDEDGGFVVPKAISTKINEYKRQMEFDLSTLVDVEITSVVSGSFTYAKLANLQPWEEIEEWENIPEVEGSQFERKQFAIKNYGGILALPKFLLQDTDQNLLNHVAKLIARRTLITRNSKILALINTTYTTKKSVATADDIKDIMDLDLDPAFKPGTVIVTNNYGYNFLRKLKDDKGNYLMQPDITQPDKRHIDGKLVVEVPVRTLPNVEDLVNDELKVPIFFGEFKEAIRLYDRGVYEVDATTIGGDSWKRNSLDMRVIDRFDVIALDDAAVVAGEITLAK